MYQQFYNFSSEPFRLSPDHDFAYAHKGYTKARAYMEYAFLRAEGFVMITGRPGTGKTTLIRALLAELTNTSVSVANLVCTQLQADDLLKVVAYEFSVPTSVVEKGELLQRLTQQLKSWHRDGRRALLIVDEAQDLSTSAMEELRLLTNIQVDSRPLLQIFLLGQPELRELVLSPRMEQVHQRIIAASHLQPLHSDETEAYIRHRLDVVRWQGNPAISKAVYPLIYKFSEGVPRRINLICSRLLLHCSVEQKHQVVVADVREVIRELQDENLASGDSFADSDFQAADVFEAPARELNPTADPDRVAGPFPPGRKPDEPQQRGTSDEPRQRVPPRQQPAEPSDSVAPARRTETRAEATPEDGALQPGKDASRASGQPSERIAAVATAEGGAPLSVTSHSPSARNGTLQHASGRVAYSAADPAQAREARASRDRYATAVWPLMIVVPGAFLWITWMILGLDAGNFMDVLPPFLNRSFG